MTYREEVRNAVRFFWQKRRQQSSSQGGGTDRDRGARSAVTGGKQMDGFVQLVRSLLVTASVPESCIGIGKRIELPGWFRAEKQWDLIVVTTASFSQPSNSSPRSAHRLATTSITEPKKRWAAPRIFGRRIGKGHSSLLPVRFLAISCSSKIAPVRAAP